MKKTYKSPEVEIFEFDAEVQMANGMSNPHVPQGPYGPDLIESLDPGIIGPDGGLDLGMDVVPTE